MANKWTSTTLVDKEYDNEDINKALLDLLKKDNESYDFFLTISNKLNVPTQPLTAKISTNTTYLLPNKTGTTTIYIPVAYLVSSAVGSFTLSLKVTGTTNQVIVPIASSTDTITSGDLLFDVYINSSGQIISKEWSISASNSIGNYVLYSDRVARQWGTITITTVTPSVPQGATLTFPKPFSANPFTVTNGRSTGPGVALLGTSSTNETPTTVDIYVNRNTAVAAVVFWMTDGVWR